jgi:hypothetical protein
VRGAVLLLTGIFVADVGRFREHPNGTPVWVDGEGNVFHFRAKSGCWEKKDERFPHVGNAGGSFYFGGRFVVWGGWDAKDEEIRFYDPTSGGMSRLAKPPIEPRQMYAVAASARCLFIWGGRIGNDTYPLDGAIYDDRTRTWSEVPNAPLTEGDFALAAWHERSVFVVSRNGLTVYHPSSGKWEVVEDKLGIGVNVDSVLVGTSMGILCCRGITAALYDIQKKRWTTLPNLPRGVSSGCATCVMDDRVYMLFGFGDPLQRDGACLDLRSRTWRKIPEAPIEGRMYAAILPMGQHIYVWGGLSWGGKPTPTAARLQVGTLKWEELPAVPIESDRSPFKFR